jgi:mRNA interferase RelE/StbE
VTSWRLLVAPSAERTLTRLPEGIAGAVVEFLIGPLEEDPHRVGKPLQRELTGYRAARRGAYRIVYRIDEDGGIIRVTCIEHRSDVYRPR